MWQECKSDQHEMNDIWSTSRLSSNDIMASMVHLDEYKMWNCECFSTDSFTSSMIYCSFLSSETCTIFIYGDPPATELWYHAISSAILCQVMWRPVRLLNGFSSKRAYQKWPFNPKYYRYVGENRYLAATKTLQDSVNCGLIATPEALPFCN